MNVGRHGGIGILRIIELNLERPIQWIVCMLHFNELPFRHIFQKYLGVTSGPKTFKGDLAKLLETDLTHLPIINYTTIRGNVNELHEDIIHDISKDQKYLYEMSKAIQNGICSPELAIRFPGNLNHARWLTRANRILRLFISTQVPSKELVRLVCFVVKVYAPCWFTSSSIHIAITERAIYIMQFSLCKKICYRKNWKL